MSKLDNMHGVTMKIGNGHVYLFAFFFKKNTIGMPLQHQLQISQSDSPQLMLQM